MAQAVRHECSERRELVGTELAPLSGSQIAERDRADRDANQPQGRMADGRRHAADLAIAPFADRQAQPRRRHVLAEPDRHRSIGQGRRLGK